MSDGFSWGPAPPWGFVTGPQARGPGFLEHPLHAPHHLTEDGHGEHVGKPSLSSPRPEGRHTDRPQAPGPSPCVLSVLPLLLRASISSSEHGSGNGVASRGQCYTSTWTHRAHTFISTHPGDSQRGRRCGPRCSCGKAPEGARDRGDLTGHSAK